MQNVPGGLILGLFGLEIEYQSLKFRTETQIYA